ncbi:MAG: tRNA epoxyqueuosine(34) reductase QueG [Alphaproteobacteria bacterium]|nr:tRNA epoxyqueuosine(34) reductase QueG [Alphaproteobacteria bacterium]
MKRAPRKAELLDPREAVRAEAQRRGFDAVGFAPASLPDAARADLRAFLAQGLHGDMGWMAETEARRGDPNALWPEARSVIVLAASYAPEQDPLAELAQSDRGYVSVYARGRDYHDVMKGRMKGLGQWVMSRFGGSFKVFVDTAPVMEKPLAAQTRLGWQGKHTVLVSRQFGSWLFLGEIFTTLALEPDEPHRDHCGRCRRCMDICPTDAFPAPYRLDVRRCISYLTIEHEGPIPEELRPAIGNRVFGCDDCVAVCPWNSFAQAAREMAFAPRGALRGPELARLAALDDGAFRALFAASPVKRTGRDRFVRNVLVAIGNSGESALLPAARARLDDASFIVRDAAQWAVQRLEAAGARQESGS